MYESKCSVWAVLWCEGAVFVLVCTFLMVLAVSEYTIWLVCAIRESCGQYFGRPDVNVCY